RAGVARRHSRRRHRHGIAPRDPARGRGVPRTDLWRHIDFVGDADAARHRRTHYPARRMSALLELTGVEIRFGGLRAVAGLDLSVAPGAVHALIGPNGAGKSTVLNAISRFVTPAAGAMRFGGESLLSSRPHQVAQRGIGRSFQNIELCGQLSALDNVLIGMSTHIAERNPFWPSPAR